MYRPGNIGELLTGENRRAGRSIQASPFDGGRTPVAAREDFTRLTGLEMPPLAAWFRGPAAVGRVLPDRGLAGPGVMRLFASSGLPPVLAPDLDLVPA